MQTYTLSAEIREKTGRRAKTLRKDGLIPAVIYGAGLTPQNLSINENTFLKIYREAGESSLVDLVIDAAAPVKVLIQEVQMDPVRDLVDHIDFRQVRMDEKLETDINLKFVGESPAIKELGGVLVRSLDSLRVRCLPGALVHEIEVPLESLKAFEDKIRLSDIKIPEGIEVLDSPQTTVALIEAPRSEEELKKLDETSVEAGVEAVEVLTKKAEDVVEGAEDGGDKKEEEKKEKK